MERAGRHDHPAGVHVAMSGVRCQASGIGNQPGHLGVAEDREGVPVGVAGEVVGDLVLARVAVRGAGEVLARQAVVARGGEQSQ